MSIYKGYSSYYEWLRSQFLTKRKILENGLKLIGIDPLPSRGGFFLMAKLPPYFDNNSVYKELVISSHSIDHNNNNNNNKLNNNNNNNNNINLPIISNSITSSSSISNSIITSSINNNNNEYIGDLYLPRPESLQEPYDWKYCRLLASSAGRFF